MPELNKKQLLNIESILEASSEFSHDADIDYIDTSFDKDTLVLESGHQPNFLPHAGLLKKAFLLHLYRNRADDRGKKAIALFGFPDYNLCTAKLLTMNKFPAFNRLGYEKFGFKIKEKDIWKRFDCLPKPPEKELESTIEKISTHYRRYSNLSNTELKLNDVIDTLEDCYKLAKNFPDINAFFISRICNELGIKVNFFRYSDLQRKGVFIEQWKDIISNLEQYNNTYNNSIRYYNLDIPICSPDSLPFWYHCTCGCKVALHLSQGYATGTCRICASEHEIDPKRLEETFSDMSPNAVARNIIFSQGMGTNIFISGTGGGLVYGKISSDISRKLGYNLPITVSWKSRDYYSGPAHEAALIALARACGIKRENILAEDINSIINDKKKVLKEKAADSRQKGRWDEINKYEGDYRNIHTSVDTSKAIFATTPSFTDILVSQGITKIRECWIQALGDSPDYIDSAGSTVEPVITRDAIYDTKAPDIYKKLEGIL